ncbi:unnamed protein product, partial [marine sediment metagenome]
MDKKNFRFFGIFIALVVVLSIYFVLAVAGPTDLTFGDNTTANYDKEGNFTVNWSDDGDAESYLIYIGLNGTVFITDNNNSATGYFFTNTTDGNYSFIVEETNDTTSA